MKINFTAKSSKVFQQFIFGYKNESVCLFCIFPDRGRLPLSTEILRPKSLTKLLTLQHNLTQTHFLNCHNFWEKTFTRCPVGVYLPTYVLRDSVGVCVREREKEREKERERERVCVWGRKNKCKSTLMKELFIREWYSLARMLPTSRG